MGGQPGGPEYGDRQDASVLPEDLATQSVRLKEDQIRREGACRPDPHGQPLRQD